MKRIIEILKLWKIKEEIEQRMDILNKLLIIKRDPNVEIEYNILNRRLKKIVNEINTCESRGCWYEYCYRN